MPSRHERKNFIENGIYHVFNRGIDKSEIFHSPADYIYFTECMTLYLLPKIDHAKYFGTLGYDIDKIARLVSKASQIMNFADEISLSAYCLMPNHFHLLVKQKHSSSMTKFLKSLLTRYSMYYSRKYNHLGPLFQGRYKAINIKSSVYLEIVTNYIHQNPKDINRFSQNVEEYPWSSGSRYSKMNLVGWMKKAQS